jgi:acyl-CoA hydrolase
LTSEATTAPEPEKTAHEAIAPTGHTPQSVDERFAFEPHNCFACGRLNTNGLHLDLHVDGERCWTDLSIPDRFQGWDDIAHGGIVATILDEVMAWSVIDHDNWGLTARMSVDFKRPVPLGRPIHAEGRVTGVRRRIITTAGTINDPATGEILATAEATFVAAPEERKAELQKRYGYRPTIETGA